MSRQHSQSRENINFPEDEVVGGSEGGIEEIGGSSSPGKMKEITLSLVFLIDLKTKFYLR